MPSALKPQWVREWQATTDVPIATVDGRPEERQRQYASTRRGFLVIGYEQLLRDLGAVHEFNPEIVVLDEAQRIKNWETKSAAYVKTLRARYRLVLTGHADGKPSRRAGERARLGGRHRARAQVAAARLAHVRRLGTAHRAPRARETSTRSASA